MGIERTAQGIEIDQPGAVHRDDGHAVRRASGGGENCIVFASGDDEVPPDAEQREVIGFRSAAGEDDLVRSRRDQRGNAVARLLDDLPGRGADAMDGRRVANTVE